MKGRLLLVLFVVGLMVSCDFERVEISRSALDSLRSEVIAGRQMSETMAEIGILIDSIDDNRSVIRTHMLEGASYESYVARMRDINEYVKKAERKLIALQRTAKKSNDAAYKALIKRLKNDLEFRNSEVAALKEQISSYHNENEGLIKTVSLQKAEIAEKLEQIKTKQAETAQLEQQVTELLTKARLDQGDALFLRATAVEETANRTHFAPKKKKRTREEALDLYRMALLFGKEEAKDKISALERKM